jgi:hypothetical protein
MSVREVPRPLRDPEREELEVRRLGHDDRDALGLRGLLGACRARRKKHEDQRRERDP